VSEGSPAASCGCSVGGPQGRFAPCGPIQATSQGTQRQQSRTAQPSVSGSLTAAGALAPAPMGKILSGPDGLPAAGGLGGAAPQVHHLGFSRSDFETRGEHLAFKAPWRNEWDAAGVDVPRWEKRQKSLVRGALREILQLVPWKQDVLCADGKVRDLTAWSEVKRCGAPMLYGDYDGNAGKMVSYDLRPFTCDKTLYCPACAARKSQEDARLLRAFLGSQVDELAAELGETGDVELAKERATWLIGRADLTQQDYMWNRKRGSAVEVVDRLFDSWQSMTKGSRAKKEPCREKKPESWGRYWWTQMVAGSFYSFEFTVNDKRGSYHPHFHVAFRLKVPPAWFVQECGMEDPVDAVMEWVYFCFERMTEVWRVFSPVAEKKQKHIGWTETNAYRSSNVNIQRCDDRNLYQVCKYSIKAIPDGAKLLEAALKGESVFDHTGVTRRAEMIIALKRRHLKGRGTGLWNGWREVAEELDTAARLEDGEVGEVEVVPPGEDESSANDATVRLSFGSIDTLEESARAGGRTVVRYPADYAGLGDLSIDSRTLRAEVLDWIKRVRDGPPEKRPSWVKGSIKGKAAFKCWSCGEPQHREGATQCGKCRAHHCHSCGECLCNAGFEARRSA